MSEAVRIAMRDTASVGIVMPDPSAGALMPDESAAIEDLRAELEDLQDQAESEGASDAISNQVEEVEKKIAEAEQRMKVRLEALLAYNEEIQAHNARVEAHESSVRSYLLAGVQEKRQLFMDSLQAELGRPKSERRTDGETPRNKLAAKRGSISSSKYELPGAENLPEQYRGQNNLPEGLGDDAALEPMLTKHSVRSLEFAKNIGNLVMYAYVRSLAKSGSRQRDVCQQLGLNHSGISTFVNGRSNLSKRWVTALKGWISANLDPDLEPFREQILAADPIINVNWGVMSVSERREEQARLERERIRKAGIAIADDEQDVPVGHDLTESRLIVREQVRAGALEQGIDPVARALEGTRRDQRGVSRFEAYGVSILDGKWDADDSKSESKGETA